MLNKKLKNKPTEEKLEVKESDKKLSHEESWQKITNTKDKSKIAGFFRNLTEEWIESCDKKILEDIFKVIEPAYIDKSPISTRERQKLYKIQEKLFGSLDDVIKEKLERLGKTLVTQEEKRVRQIKYNLPSNGTVIIKEWRGKKLEIKIVQGGFRYEGRFYKSLSLLARELTGYHCSGPLFFGLRKTNYKVDNNGQYQE